MGFSVAFLIVFLVASRSLQLGEAQQGQCPFDTPFTITVRKDDCLSRMAEASQTTVRQWMDYNPSITDGNLIQVGWILCAPAGAQRFSRRLLKNCNGLPVILASSDNDFTGVPEDQQPAPIFPPQNRRTVPRLPSSNSNGGFTADQQPSTLVQQPQSEIFISSTQAQPQPQPQPSVPHTTFVTFSLGNTGFSQNVPSTDSPVPDQSSSDQPSIVVQSSSQPQPTVPPTAAPQTVPIPQQPAATPVAPASLGSIDPNIVQCQYFSSGFANCLRGCTSDEFQYDVDQSTNSKITMRQCIENKGPAIHSWLATDGILPPWLQPVLIPAGQKEKIVAACTFRRDRSFSCRSTTRCEASQNGELSCAGAVLWRGQATEGDPLKKGSVMKGSITDNSSNIDASGAVQPAQANVRLLSAPVLNQDQVRTRNSIRRQKRAVKKDTEI